MPKLFNKGSPSVSCFAHDESPTYHEDMSHSMNKYASTTYRSTEKRVAFKKDRLGDEDH